MAAGFSRMRCCLWSSGKGPRFARTHGNQVLTLESVHCSTFRWILSSGGAAPGAPWPSWKMVAAQISPKISRPSAASCINPRGRTSEKGSPPNNHNKVSRPVAPPAPSTIPSTPNPTCHGGTFPSQFLCSNGTKKLGWIQPQRAAAFGPCVCGSRCLIPPRSPRITVLKEFPSLER